MGIFSDQQFIIYVAYALTGLSTFIVTRMLLEEQETRAAQENLGTGDRQSSNALVRFTRPFFKQYVVPMVRGKPFWESYRTLYRRKLIAAGLKEELTPDELISFKLFQILFFPLVAGVLKAGDFIDLSPLFFLILPALGWFYPDFWIKGQTQKRQQKVIRAMPFIIDLLALSTEAGLDFIGAIGKVVEKAKPSPLVDEFGQLLQEIKVGSSRQEALREMAARIDMTEINSFVAILISADQMGASIGRVLRQQSESIRADRMLRAEKAGAAAGQKILLPLVIFMVPAVFLMIAGPFVLGFIYGSRGGGF